MKLSQLPFSFPSIIITFAPLLEKGVMQQVLYQDLGHISFPEAWRFQEKLRNEMIALKRKNRELNNNGEPSLPIQHHLLLCEHSPVYTLGKSGSLKNLLIDEKSLAEKGIQFFKINRGGDITYHGPGQITGYPIFDLDQFFTDIRRYIRYLEEAIILILADYNIEGYRIEKFTGVWLPPKGQLPARKICAIGVHLSRWVTMHGFAFNINTDLDYFRYITPCGIDDKDKDVTSLSRELGYAVDIQEVKDKLRFHFSSLFGFEFV